MASGPVLASVQIYPPYTDIDISTTITTVVSFIDQQIRTPIVPDVVQLIIHAEQSTPVVLTYTGLPTSPITELVPGSYQAFVPQQAQAGPCLLTWISSSTLLGTTSTTQSKINLVEVLT